MDIGEDVTIPQVGTSSDFNKKGTDGPNLNTESPHIFDFHTIAEYHALEIIDGSHFISEEGLDLWIQHFP